MSCGWWLYCCLFFFKLVLLMKSFIFIFFLNFIKCIVIWYSCWVSLCVGVIMMVCGFWMLFFISWINGKRKVCDFLVLVWDCFIKFVFLRIFGMILFWILVGFLKLRFLIVLIKFLFKLKCLNGCFDIICFFLNVY